MGILEFLGKVAGVLINRKKRTKPRTVKIVVPQIERLLVKRDDGKYKFRLTDDVFWEVDARWEFAGNCLGLFKRVTPISRRVSSREREELKNAFLKQNVDLAREFYNYCVNFDCLNYMFMLDRLKTPNIADLFRSLTEAVTPMRKKVDTFLRRVKSIVAKVTWNEMSYGELKKVLDKRGRAKEKERIRKQWWANYRKPFYEFLRGKHNLSPAEEQMLRILDEYKYEYKKLIGRCYTAFSDEVFSWGGYNKVFRHSLNKSSDLIGLFKWELKVRHELEWFLGELDTLGNGTFSAYGINRFLRGFVNEIKRVVRQSHYDDMSKKELWFFHVNAFDMFGFAYFSLLILVVGFIEQMLKDTEFRDDLLEYLALMVAFRFLDVPSWSEGDSSLWEANFFLAEELGSKTFSSFAQELVNWIDDEVFSYRIILNGQIKSFINWFVSYVVPGNVLLNLAGFYYRSNELKRLYKDVLEVLK